jgi:hypothetical protein
MLLSTSRVSRVSVPRDLLKRKIELIREEKYCGIEIEQCSAGLPIEY